MTTNKGIEQLKKDEGFTPRASHLTLQSGEKEKVVTLGYGYNINAAADPIADLVAAGITEEEAHRVLSGEKEITKEQGELLFHISAQRAVADASRIIPGFEELDPELRDVFVNMAYQLGGKGLRKFKKMRRNLVKQDYKGVAREIMNSRFAKHQATNRAKRLASKVVEVGKRLEVEQPRVAKPSAEEILREQVKSQQIERIRSVVGPRQQVNRVAEALRTMMQQQEQMAARKEEDPEENQ